MFLGEVRSEFTVFGCTSIIIDKNMLENAQIVVNIGNSWIVGHSNFSRKFWHLYFFIVVESSAVNNSCSDTICWNFEKCFNLALQNIFKFQKDTYEFTPMNICELDINVSQNV